MKSFKEILVETALSKGPGPIKNLALELAFRIKAIHAKDLPVRGLSVEFSNVFSWDYPDFVDAYVDHGTFDGVLLPNYILDELNDDAVTRDYLLREFLT